MPSILRCGLSLLLADMSLHLLGLRRTLRLAHRLGASTPRRTQAAGASRELARRVAVAAAFYPRRALCLEQSLALFVLTRRAALPAELRLGVQSRPFRAHAWVVVGGVPINEGQDLIEQLVPFPIPGG